MRNLGRVRTKTEICSNVGGSTKRRDSLAPIRMAQHVASVARLGLRKDQATWPKNIATS